MERRVPFGRHDGKEDRANPTRRSLQLRLTFFARLLSSRFPFQPNCCQIPLLPEGMQDRRTANSNVKWWDVRWTMSNSPVKLPDDQTTHWRNQSLGDWV